MHAKTAKITSRTAAITALMAAGLASGTAARAATPQVVPVACSTAALAAALSNADDGAPPEPGGQVHVPPDRRAAGAGGGLFIGSEFTAMVTGTSIWGNSAENGGGIYDEEIANQFSLPFTNDKITGNHASADGGGIYNLASAFPAGLLNLAHTRISYNDAGSLGGGIYNAGALAAADTTISRNTAHGGGGICQAIEDDGYGVRLTSSAVLHNTPDNCEPPGTIMGCNG
jgi:hypothetical protein